MSIGAGTRFRVLVSDSVDVSGLEVLRSVASVDVRTKLLEDQLCEIIPEYDALVVRSGTKVTGRIIQYGKKLKIIGRAGVGVDNVDVEAATNCGIFVVNSPQGNTIAAAEHTLALMFATARNVAAADASIRSGKWIRENFMGCQLQHKTLGIIGLGQVGSHVAKICREIGMSLIVYDPYINIAKAQSLGCRIAELDELLHEADVVTLHVPLVPTTKHLIDERRLKLMKTNAIIINCSRGGVVDETALCCALREKRIGAAALDVFENEGCMKSDSILLNTPNLCLTPHLGASTKEAQVNVAVDVAQQVRQALLGHLPESAVNIPGLRVAELASLRPLLQCCEKLGRVAMQLLSGPLEEITVVAEGEFANVEKSDALLLSTANGALGVHTASRVNFVNVKRVAEQHRIKMVVAKDSHNEKSCISVKLRSGQQTVHIRGTVTEDKDVLLKAFDNVHVYMILPSSNNRLGGGASSVDESLLQKATFLNDQKFVTDENLETYSIPSESKPIHFIYSRHDDTPGVLAAITTTLGNAGVNIANCHLGRQRSNSGSAGSALAIFHIDNEIPDTITNQVKKIGAVKECKIFTV